MDYALITLIVGAFVYLVFIKNNDYVKIINTYAKKLNHKENEVKNLQKANHNLVLKLISQSNDFKIINSFKYNFPFPLIIKNQNNKIIYVNNAFKELFNKDKSEVLGKDTYEIWGENIANRIKKLEKKIIEGNLAYLVLNLKVKNNEGITKEFMVIKWNQKLENEIIASYTICYPNDEIIIDK